MSEDMHRRSPNPVEIMQRAEKALPNKRRHGRLACEGLTCSLGTISDFSASGLRVVVASALKIRAGQSFHVTLRCAAGEVTVPVVVRRVRKFRLFKQELGLEFLELSDAQKATISRLAQIVVKMRVM